MSTKSQPRPRCLNAVMPYLTIDDDPYARQLLVGLGRELRRARRRRGLSQDQLEVRSGVDQTAISRLERGLAPALPVRRLVRLGDALGRDLPLGTCPHDHECIWQPVRNVPEQDRGR